MSSKSKRGGKGKAKANARAKARAQAKAQAKAQARAAAQAKAMRLDTEPRPRAQERADVERKVRELLVRLEREPASPRGTVFELHSRLEPPEPGAEREPLTLSVTARAKRGREAHPFEVRSRLTLASELDAKLARCLPGGESAPLYRRRPDDPRGTYRLDSALAERLVPLLARSGRCRLGEGPPLTWEGDAPLRPAARIERDPDRGTCRLVASLAHEGERVPIGPETLVLGGCLVHEGRVRPIVQGRALAWALAARSSAERPLDEEALLVTELAACSSFVDVELTEVRRVPAQAVLALGAPGDDRRIPFTLLFDYDGPRVRGGERGELVVGGDGVPIARDSAAEERATAELASVPGIALEPLGRGALGSLDEGQLGELVQDLAARGWWVEARERRLRAAGRQRIDIRPRTGGFDLAAEAEYEGGTLDLAAALAALRAGERYVRLDDGSLGLVPEAWLQGWLTLDLATVQRRKDSTTLFFRASQARLLEGWLQRTGVLVEDAAIAREFHELRARLDGLGEVEPEDPPPGFTATLRPYQREALGWMRFLREVAVGGCLADDMGLGKTVQVLAHLSARQAEDPVRRALVVAPRSVVHQWGSEAARFAPHLRVHEHGGAGRMDRIDELREADLIVTSYGTLRRDVEFLAGERFDTVVLDEATAVKNAASQTARAACALQGDLRLALSGTPLENHVGELWSLCEFLNPGMLGPHAAFRRLFETDDRGRDEAIAGIARAIGPFFLRRTKDEVLRDLPPRSDETVVLDLSDGERALYAGLATAFRSDLALDRPGADVPAGARVLTALLRLRQAACHPGLADPARRDERSTKLDFLVARLTELAEEGHKALVFSQFTSFLAIVRDRLASLGIDHESLDGRTRDRARRVDRFQQDPGCSVFLVSLKAGGHGLNLTAADYVFLLDPWWNPAFEEQAVGRTHRLGRERPVVSYRLIARDTVEERVQALQEDKRDLAAKLLAGTRTGIRGLSREMLELLIR